MSEPEWGSVEHAADWIEQMQEMEGASYSVYGGEVFALAKMVVAQSECIDRMRDGWRVGRSQGEWEHSDAGYLPEPMSPEQAAVMAR